ncbi:MAG: glycosyltransferase [Candidatus Nanoarchaeia archaeon]|nr:glycosyltransferase [Candidatus Nanoarchaeia archaeon]MDD5587627.1 glycosyltransferase [Candidatus Nanoarchaeia archaeon]
MVEKLKFSIVIPLIKINDYVRECVKNILKQSYTNFEIIITTEADEKEKFPKTRIIKLDRSSPSTARNVGVRNAKGDIIAFIDDDAYPSKDWLKNSVKYFDDENVTGVAGPGVEPPNSTFMEKVSGKVYELSSGKVNYRYKKGKKVMEVDDYPTCNLLIRKEDFESVGGFNDRYWGGEDTELCHSLTQNLKRKIIYDPDVLVYHHRRKDLRGHLRQSMFWAMWRGFFVRKFPKTSFRLTYFIPPMFFLGLIFGAILSIFSKFLRNVYLVCLGIYLLYLIYIGIKTKSIKYAFPVMFVTLLTHLAYGFGFLKGFLSKEPTKKTWNPVSVKLKK